ncbi:MAG TPA: hypothetical protein VGP24_13035, partial [Glaciihabitans sp.]|nr:hypothetical protein [Glaciihabitans sp.]
MIVAKKSSRRALTGFGIAVIAASTLTGCFSGETVAVPTVTVTVTPSPEPTPTPSPTPTFTPTPEPTVEPTVEPTTPPVEPPAELLPDPEEEIVLKPPVDNGVIPNATGYVQVDSAGTPYRYTVAAGDIAVEICTRFSRYIWQLTDNNGVTLDNPFLIHEGDTILLTANPRPEGYV